MTVALTRRQALACLAATCSLALPAAAQSVIPSLEEVGAAFRALPQATRLRAQHQMTAMAFYFGPKDGLWGAGTAESFRQGMRLEEYREFARGLPADRSAAARETVLFFAPEELAH